MSGENGKAPNGWKVASALFTIALALLGVLYSDARGDITQLQHENRSTADRLARVETLVKSIDNRTERIEDKLDAALDRPITFSNRPGPR